RRTVGAWPTRSPWPTTASSSSRAPTPTSSRARSRRSSPPPRVATSWTAGARASPASAPPTSARSAPADGPPPRDRPLPARWSGQSVEPRHQSRRRDGAVGVLAHLGDLVPVDVAVEAHPDPAAVTDVGRAEEPVGIGAYELLLRA